MNDMHNNHSVQNKWWILTFHTNNLLKYAHIFRNKKRLCSWKCHSIIYPSDLFSNTKSSNNATPAAAMALLEQQSNNNTLFFIELLYKSHIVAAPLLLQLLAVYIQLLLHLTVTNYGCQSKNKNN